VLCWGLNEYGQLGNGNTTDSTTPVPVVGLSSGVVSIAAGYESTCALTSGGAVWCWGYNATGQLGNGTFTLSSTPVEVLDPAGNAPLSDVAVIAAGQYHTCAVTNAGAALCWGDNAKSELGNGTDMGSNIPVAVSGLSSGVATISAGSYFTCAVTTVGGALCWGEGTSGQLGNGNATNSTTPAEVLDPTGNAPLSGVVAISASFENACALTSAGTVQCWGANTAGQLGIAATGPQSNIPVEVLDSTGKSPLTDVVAIAAGQSHTCAVNAAGAALCWGDNSEGELGNSSSSDADSPVPVSGLSSGVAAIAAGYGHTCAVTSSGAAQCWGRNLDGQIDSGSTMPSSTPVDAVGVGNTGFLQLF
jgi:alpha-tubulin suppressor-like RCC1 family protein